MRKVKYGAVDAYTLWLARAVLVSAGGVLALLYHQVITSVETLQTFQAVTISRLATIEEALRHITQVR